MFFFFIFIRCVQKARTWREWWNSGNRVQRWFIVRFVLSYFSHWYSYIMWLHRRWTKLLPETYYIYSVIFICIYTPHNIHTLIVNNEIPIRIAFMNYLSMTYNSVIDFFRVCYLCLMLLTGIYISIYWCRWFFFVLFLFFHSSRLQLPA